MDEGFIFNFNLKILRTKTNEKYNFTNFYRPILQFQEADDLTRTRQFKKFVNPIRLKDGLAVNYCSRWVSVEILIGSVSRSFN